MKCVFTSFFFEGIRADPTTKEKMPKDGTVFQLTSNVILFLEQIMEYVDTLAMILTQDTSYNQTLLRLPRKISVSDRNPALVGLYIRKVLVQLNLTLVNKSDYYADQFLKAVFRLNNNQYILKGEQIFISNFNMEYGIPIHNFKILIIFVLHLKPFNVLDC